MLKVELEKFNIFLTVGLFFVLLPINWAQAQPAEEIVELRIDKPTLLKGYTVSSPDGNLRIGIFPEVLAEETAVTLKQYDKSQFVFPDGWQAVGNVYEFDIANKNAFHDHRPLQMRLSAATESRAVKKAFFWNGVKNIWVELPSETVDEKVVKSVLHLPYAKMAILAKNDTMEIGRASWYKYKDCDCAASPDFPKGSLVKVKNLNNGKELTVKINDYGPDRSIFPDRVIDLDKVAFEKLGPLGAGVLQRILVKGSN